MISVLKFDACELNATSENKKLHNYNLPNNAAVGIDPWCISVDTAQRWERAFTKKRQKLVQTSTNLVDEVWKNRPPAETNPVIIQPVEFAGRSVADKLEDLRERLMQEKAQGIIITALDEVAWLYNVRGTDVSYCPVVHAFAIVTSKSAFFYVDKKKVSSEVSCCCCYCFFLGISPSLIC
ncbi:putative Xaa-Pro aminopeptidase P [Vitis vinifera]|uniref:Putative Xaa-Pro aminopeptidase P n=1 Tax=Vitis vinifera TaxID=29760 RepID=A0A438CIN0_VITVI|nr:putative Xaa-Pro aminopeptidase P [Vitis vinifera]